MIFYFPKAYWAEFLVSCSPIRFIKRESDPISLEPVLNPLSYLLSHLFKPILFPF
jgi:hypothetical protein